MRGDGRSRAARQPTTLGDEERPERNEANGKDALTCIVAPVACWSKLEHDKTDDRDTPTCMVALETHWCRTLEHCRGENANCNDFSQKLASRAAIFVNDSFSLSHKIRASVVGITRFCYASIAGFHFEEELVHLVKFNDTTRRPYIAIIGGSMSGSEDSRNNFSEPSANMDSSSSPERTASAHISSQKHKEKTIVRKTARKEYARPADVRAPEANQRGLNISLGAPSSRLTKKLGQKRARKRVVHVVGRPTSMYEDPTEVVEEDEE
ncbi:phosphoglycerate kinase-like [Hordeum vulgare]|nr:phosphoglycerate kinase-like [Hordeum vulgare]